MAGCDTNSQLRTLSRWFRERRVRCRQVMALEAGTRLGHYEVVSSLGAGGMGEVYRAKDTKLGRVAAIKVLHDAIGDGTVRALAMKLQDERNREKLWI